MSWLPFVLIPAVYFVAGRIQPKIKPSLAWIACPVCASVSSTWIILLALSFAGYAVDSVSVAVLMGMSVTGIMFKSTAWFEQKRMKHIGLLRLVMVLGGFAIVTSFLSGRFSTSILFGVLSLILVAIVGFLLQGEKGRGAGGLEHCCD